MKNGELAQIVAAILITFIIFSLTFVFKGDYYSVAQVFIFSFFIILVYVLAKKIVAYAFDSSVEHRIWGVYSYGVKPKQHFKKEKPFGLFVPLLFSLVSTGLVKVATILTYETRALKHRAAKRFGFYSYAEMTDWHNGLIGASGIAALLILSLVGYLVGFELLFKMAAYYAFWNMVPVSDLDGTQIFFGSRIVWAVLALTTFLFAFYGFVL